MKNLWLSLLAGVALLGGCTTASNPIALDQVGPQMFHESADSTGTLIVFSAVEIGPNRFDPSNEQSHPTSYEIWTKDGANRLQVVRNYSLPLIDGAPARVELPPGEYLVKAQANHSAVNVPVVVVANRVTDVHLDGNFARDVNHSSPDHVYLPDGSVVGARARPAGDSVAANLR